MKTKKYVNLNELVENSDKLELVRATNFLEVY